MELDKILIIKGDYNEFEKYYLENINECGIKASSDYREAKRLKIMRKIWTHIGFPLENIWYGNWKKNLNEYKLIIIFDSIQSKKMIEYIVNNVNHDCRVILWHWNPLNNIKSINLYYQIQDLCEHWTFDTHDEKKYGMKLNSQFFFWPKCRVDEITNDVLFVGTDKGRFEKLAKIYDSLLRCNLKSEFAVLKDKTSILTDDRLYINKSIPYSVVLDKIQRSQALLELVQNGQTGLTARTLEAIFYNKKLITDNVLIRDMSFYHPSNIYIIEKMELENINEFLEAPYIELPKEIISYYSLESWIERFC